MTLSTPSSAHSAHSGSAPPDAMVRDAVLLVEDSPDQAALMRRWLETFSDAEVVHRADAESAERLLDSRDWSLIISDIELPGMDGLELIRRSRAVNRWVPTLLVTARESFEYARRALENKADDFLVKPLKPQLFIEKASALMRAGREQRKRHQHVVLAIGAHPDDVEVGCGGILLRHAAQGDQTVILTLTGGTPGGPTSERVVESRRAAELLGAQLIVGHLPDAGVSEGLETISVITDAIRRHRPSVIYTHSLNDDHQDHRATHRATTVAARGIDNLYCYQSVSSTIDFTPTLFMDIGDYLTQKVRIIDMYRTPAASQPRLHSELVAATSKYWGRFADYRLVEPLEVIRRSE